MELTRIVHTSILESPIPAKVIAKKINKPYSTLLREVNPYDEGAKLGVETFLDILKITGDTAPLEYIANELGLELVSRKMRKAG
jgi:hypothetical protein